MPKKKTKDLSSQTGAEIVLEERISSYVRSLRDYRDRGPDDCRHAHEVLDQFSYFITLDSARGGSDFAAATRRTIRKWQRCIALDRDTVAVLRDFADWLEGKAKPLTNRRVAALHRFAEKATAPPPSRRDVNALLDAPDRSTQEGLRDAVAIALAAGGALSASDLVTLEVGCVDLVEGTITVPGRPPRCLRLDGLMYDQMAQLIDGRESEAPLFATLQGEPLKPRYLQQRVALYVRQLGDRPSEPLTLERLRDSAARSILRGGGTWERLSGFFGHARVAVTRRRFGGELWAYLADHDGDWFTLEAATQADGVVFADAQEWVAAGMRHERRGEQVYVRKEDLRVARDRARVAGQQTAYGPGVREAAERVWSARDNADASAEAFQELLDATEAPAVSLADTLKELHADTCSIFAELRRLRRSHPEWTGWQRVRTALGDASSQYEVPDDTDVYVIRAEFMRSTVWLRLLELNMGSIDFGRPGLIWQLTASQLQSPQGVNALREAFKGEPARLVFWLLVDRSLDRLEAGLGAADELYGTDHDRMEQVGTGCLLYSFYVGMVAAAPAVCPDPRWSAQMPETVWWEAFSHWLMVTLSACGALRTHEEGDQLWRVPWYPDKLDPVAFARDVEERWATSCRYRRTAWSFDVMPAANPLDVAGYAALAFRRAHTAQKNTAEELSARFLFLALLPPARLLLPEWFLDTPYLRWVVYMTFVPLLRKEFEKTIRRLCQVYHVHASTLAERWPLDRVERCLHLVERACERFSFWQNDSHEQGPETPGQIVHRFASYLGKAAQREFRHTGKAVVADLRAAPLEGGPQPEAEEEDAWAAGNSDQQVKQKGTDVEITSEELEEAEDVFTSSCLPEFQLIRGDDGSDYVTVRWAHLASAVPEHWLQRHAGELNARRAKEVIRDVGRRLDCGLVPEAFLLPYDPDFAPRVGKLWRESGGKDVLM